MPAEAAGACARRRLWGGDWSREIGVHRGAPGPLDPPRRALWGEWAIHLPPPSSSGRLPLRCVFGPRGATRRRNMGTQRGGHPALDTPVGGYEHQLSPLDLARRRPAAIHPQIETAPSGEPLGLRTPQGPQAAVWLPPGGQVRGGCAPGVRHPALGGLKALRRHSRALERPWKWGRGARRLYYQFFSFGTLSPSSHIPWNPLCTRRRQIRVHVSETLFSGHDLYGKMAKSV